MEAYINHVFKFLHSKIYHAFNKLTDENCERSVFLALFQLDKI